MTDPGDPGAAPRRSRWKTWVALVLVLVAVAGTAILAPVVLIEIDDGWAIPPSTDVPDLPAGVTIASDERQCGSGGCWRELTVRGPEHRTAEDVAASLGIPEETCRARSLLDRRRVCTGVTVAGDDVRIYLLFERRLGL